MFKYEREHTQKKEEEKRKSCDRPYINKAGKFTCAHMEKPLFSAFQVDLSSFKNSSNKQNNGLCINHPTLVGKKKEVGFYADGN